MKMQPTKEIRRLLCLALYYGLATHLPRKSVPVLGKISNNFRILCAKGIFKHCGKVSTIGKRAYFGTGKYVEIGNYSGIGDDCTIPNNAIIGEYVMMGPQVYMARDNHKFANTETPMYMQGMQDCAPIRIEDDCWIGARAIVTPGRRIGQGCIVAAGAVVTKDIPQYSVVGGNPAKVIKRRK